MPHNDPDTYPTIQRPQTYTTATCPHCGYSNKVTNDQILKGFRCSRCGEKVNGIGSGHPNPDDPQPIRKVVCPQCNGSSLEHLSGNTEGKRFRCKACGTEW